jgi:flavin-dependent dehydrogenase
MSGKPEAEVIVVGSGPAGAATAIHLARRGRKVLLLEGRDFSKPRAADMRSGEVLSPGSQQEIKRLGLPLDTGGWRLLPFNTLRHHIWHNRRVTLDPLPDGLEYWQTDRGCFDRAMFALAREAGAEVRDGCRVSNLLRDRSGAVCGVVTKAGDRPGEELRAPIIVDASGRRSALLARLKLKEPEREFRRIALVTFYEYMPGCEPGVFEQHFLPAYNTALKGSIMREGLYRFSFETDLAFRDEFASRHGKQPPYEMVMAMLKELAPDLHERFAAARPLSYSIAYAPIGYRVRQITHDGLLMVGDTAGYLDPSTGQGIEFALRTARLAAHTVDHALTAKDYRQEQFAPYLENRRQEIKQAMDWLRLYLRMTRQRPLLSLFSYLPPARAVLLRTLVKPRPMKI